MVFHKIRNVELSTRSSHRCGMQNKVKHFLEWSTLTSWYLTTMLGYHVNTTFLSTMNDPTFASTLKLVSKTLRCLPIATGEFPCAMGVSR